MRSSPSTAPSLPTFCDAPLRTPATQTVHPIFHATHTLHPMFHASTRRWSACASPRTAPSLTALHALLHAPTHPWPYIQSSPQVERVRFSKDGSQLQLTAVDGRRALVVLPNDPELVDILARNGVDISGAWQSAFCVDCQPLPCSSAWVLEPFCTHRPPCSAPLNRSAHPPPGLTLTLSVQCPRASSRATLWRCWATCCSPSSPLPACSCSSAVPATAR